MTNGQDSDTVEVMEAVEATMQVVLRSIVDIERSNVCFFNVYFGNLS